MGHKVPVQRRNQVATVKSVASCPTCPTPFSKQLEKEEEGGGVYGEGFDVIPGTPGTAVHPLVGLSTWSGKNAMTRSDEVPTLRRV